MDKPLPKWMSDRWKRKHYEKKEVITQGYILKYEGEFATPIIFKRPKTTMSLPHHRPVGPEYFPPGHTWESMNVGPPPEISLEAKSTYTPWPPRMGDTIRQPPKFEPQKYWAGFDYTKAESQIAEMVLGKAMSAYQKDFLGIASTPFYEEPPPEPPITNEQLQLMTKLHYQIVAALLPECLSVTSRMREKWKQPELKEKPVEELSLEDTKTLMIAKLLVKQMVEKDNYAHSSITHIVDLMCLISGKRFLRAAADQYRSKANQESGTKIIYDPLTIVVSIAPSSNLPIDQPFLITHGINKRTLRCRPDGKLIDNTVYADNILEDPEQNCLRVATDEEVEACLETLGALELKYILSDSLFAPHLTKLFDETVVVEEIVEENGGK